MPPQRRNGPPPQGAASTSNTTVATDHTAAHDKFRRLWSRRAKLDCGCLDQCRCDYRDNPTPMRVDGYRDAIEHLESLGLVPAALMPECRKMWTRSSAERKLSSRTVRRWTA